MSTSESMIHRSGSGGELRGLMRDVSREAKKSKTPIFIAVLAAFLALVSMADGDADRRALVAHIESANQFAFYQAKTVRATDAKIASNTFEAMQRPELAKEWETTSLRYDHEKSEILARARSEQAKRKTAIRQADYFSVAIATLQIAIVLASASLIMSGGFLLLVSSVLTGVAIFFTLNGYGLYFDVPTDPTLILNAAYGQIVSLK